MYVRGARNSERKGKQKRDRAEGEGGRSRIEERWEVRAEGKEEEESGERSVSEAR